MSSPCLVNRYNSSFLERTRPSFNKNLSLKWVFLVHVHFNPYKFRPEVANTAFWTH
jgi:hypothetical protein